MYRYLKCVFRSSLLVLIAAQGGLLFGAVSSLEENSPFIPFDYVSGPPPVAGPQKGGIELRGVLDYDGETRFSLYNPATQKSVWVKLNDKKAPYYVDSYDPEKTLITVTVNGVRQRLPISKPKEDALPPSGVSRTPSSPSPGPTPGPIPPRPPVPSKPESEEEPEEEEDSETSDASENEEEAEKVVEEEDPEVVRRRQMSEKVYEAFKKYVSEKKGQSQ